MESQLVECVGGVKGSALSWRDGSGAQARSVLLCCGCEVERGKPVATLVDLGNTDWVSKSLVWPASWPGAYDSPLAIRQGSLLFSKFEFFIKPDLRGLSFL